MVAVAAIDDQSAAAARDDTLRVMISGCSSVNRCQPLRARARDHRGSAEMVVTHTSYGVLAVDSRGLIDGLQEAMAMRRCRTDGVVVRSVTEPGGRNWPLWATSLLRTLSLFAARTVLP